MKTPSDARPDASAPPPAEQWALVRALVEKALALPQESRHDFLIEACGNDEVLRHRVERLAAAYDRADDEWGFLGQSAGELAAPLLAADPQLADGYAVDADVPLRRGLSGMADVLARLRTALADRYVVERELATGGMATVYLARDARHERQVAIKVLHPELSAMLGAARFLSEIKTTASLHHPHILPLFDSGSADGLLFYVMPLVEGESLRARLTREKQLSVGDAVRIVTDVADALEGAHGHGIVHRDIKPENILLHEGRPLVADFGIALAVQSAGAQRMTRTGLSLGTPPYMSPEQASGSATIDGRSDIYSLACVLYELLVGDPPFTGSTPQIVIARVLAEQPSSVRTVRPSVPVAVDRAIARALSKLPADRYATAREFADALVAGPTAVNAGTDAVASAAPAAAPSRMTPRPARLRRVAAVAATLVVASVVVIAVREHSAPEEITVIRYPNLIDQTVFHSVAFTPDGRALVYTGSAQAGKPLMIQPLDQDGPRVIRGTEEAFSPYVAPGGKRLLYSIGETGIRSTTIDRVTSGGAQAWRYGNGAWMSTDSIVRVDIPSRGLVKTTPTGGSPIQLSRPDTTRGESKHVAPLVLPGGRAVVFTIRMHGGIGLVRGPLAIARLDPDGVPAPHTLLGIESRPAFAFVDGWLLFISADGLDIMAARLDVERRRLIGVPTSVRHVKDGDLVTASLADNGSLLYVRQPRRNFPVVVDTNGVMQSLLASGEGPFMFPRLSPDGKQVAVQGETAEAGNDLWTYDIATRTQTRLTTEGALHPIWAPDGRHIIYMLPAFQGLASLPTDGTAPATKVAGSKGGFAPAMTPDGSAIVYQRKTSNNGWGIWSTSPSGGRTSKVVEDSGSHYMPAVSPDGHWLAEVSNETGRNEVYVRPFPGPGAALQVSNGGGVEPAWSPDGRQVYYRARGAFMSAIIRTPALAVTSRRTLFTDGFDGAMPHRNYDVLPDGSGFLMISGGTSEATVVLHWLNELRARLARAP